jgi:transcriptional regulator with XRE-family HTH domain
MDVRLRLAENIKRLRHVRGISQEALADAASVHRTHLSGVESGKRNASVLTVAKLAQALGVSAGSLLD